MKAGRRQGWVTQALWATERSWTFPLSEVGEVGEEGSEWRRNLI